MHIFSKVICNYLHLNAGNAQQSPHCFDLLNKNQIHYTLNTLHQTLHNTLTTHSKLCRCLSFICLRPSHNFLFLNNQTCCLDTSVTKAPFYHFFLHQTQSKRDGNVCKKAWRTLFTVSLVLDVPVGLVLRRWAVLVG